jgi:hypothetical protein
VGLDREASTHYKARICALNALGRSGVLSSPWTIPGTPTAHLTLGTAWPALLEALQDGDDEVREAARFATVEALGKLKELDDVLSLLRIVFKSSIGLHLVVQLRPLRRVLAREQGSHVHILVLESLRLVHPRLSSLRRV